MARLTGVGQLPCLLHAILESLLPLLDPGRIVLGSDPGIRVAEKHGDVLDRNAREQQVDGEDVPKSVTVRVVHLGGIEDAGEIPRPVGGRGPQILPAPEEVITVLCDMSQCVDDLPGSGIETGCPVRCAYSWRFLPTSASRLS